MGEGSRLSSGGMAHLHITQELIRSTSASGITRNPRDIIVGKIHPLSRVGLHVVSNRVRSWRYLNLLRARLICKLSLRAHAANPSPAIVEFRARERRIDIVCLETFIV